MGVLRARFFCALSFRAYETIARWMREVPGKYAAERDNGEEKKRKSNETLKFIRVASIRPLRSFGRSLEILCRGSSLFSKL